MVNQEAKCVNESLSSELEQYKEKVKALEERQTSKAFLTQREEHLDSQMRGIIVDRNEKVKAFETQAIGSSGNLGVMHIKDAFEEDAIPFVKNLRESFKLFEIGLYKEVHEMKSIFKQMEDEVDQCSVEKKYFEIEKKQLLINNDRLLEEIISCDIICAYLCSIHRVDNYASCSHLEIELLNQQESNKSFNELSKSFAKLEKHCIALELSLQNNKEEMISQLQEKSIVVNELKQMLTTLKKKSQVTLDEPTNLDSRFQKVEDENVSLAFHVSSLTKEREHIKVSCTNASGSQPKSNTRNDMIQRPSSRSEKNKVEVQHRKFKSNSNKNNHVSDCNSHVKNVVLSSNSETICVSCNECLFSTTHDACVVRYLNDVQRRKKDKYVKHKIKTQGKPTGRVFKTLGHKWVPTRKMFNVEEKTYSLPQNTPAPSVPLVTRLQTIRFPAVAPNTETRMRFSIAKNSIMTAYQNGYVHPFLKPNFAFTRNYEYSERSSWKFGFVGIVEIVLWYLDSGCSKHMTGQHDKLINFVSKFIGTVRLGNDHFAAIMSYGDLQFGNFLITRVYYVEGLGTIYFQSDNFVIQILK
ncbi:hypothetical protein Tco_0031875 [Tanacetum coccineum]